MRFPIDSDTSALAAVHARSIGCLVRFANSRVWLVVSMVSALCVTIACLDFSGAESESAHASQPPPYPAYLAIQAGTTYTLPRGLPGNARSEEHTSELQSHVNLVCRLLLEKKKKKQSTPRKPQKKRENNTQQR